MLNAEVVTIEQLFQLGHFRPASVQRDYEWTLKQCSELLDDLLRVSADAGHEAVTHSSDSQADADDEEPPAPGMQLDADLPESGPVPAYFLGSIVVRPKAIGSLEVFDGLVVNGQLHAVQRAWMAEGAPQCGYCQAGQIMSAVALLAKVPDPTDKDIDEAMAGNLCRCGAYLPIRRAIKLAAANLAKKG